MRREPGPVLPEVQGRGAAERSGGGPPDAYRIAPDDDYGKTDAERALVLDDLHTVEPLLRAGASAEIDTRRPVGEVADALESIAGVSGS